MTELEFLLLPLNRIFGYWRVPLGIFNVACVAGV